MTIRLDRIIAQTLTVNAASRAVMERVGLTYVRTFPTSMTAPVEGVGQGEVEFEMTRKQWERSRWLKLVRESSAPCASVRNVPRAALAIPARREPSPPDWACVRCGRRVAARSANALKPSVRPCAWWKSSTSAIAPPFLPACAPAYERDMRQRAGMSPDGEAASRPDGALGSVSAIDAKR